MKFPCSVVFFSAILLALLVDCNTGTPHRRVPFNGSMYGKRTAGALPMDYDVSGRSVSSLCLMAAEVCAAWFPRQAENK